MALAEYPGDVLHPSHVLNDLSGKPQLLVRVVTRPQSADPNDPSLLRENQIPLGLLYDGRFLTLMYAPRGEMSAPFGPWVATTQNGESAMMRTQCGSSARRTLSVARLMG